MLTFVFDVVYVKLNVTWLQQYQDEIFKKEDMEKNLPIWLR